MEIHRSKFPSALNSIVRSPYLWAVALILAMLLVLMPWRVGMPDRGLDASWCLALLHIFEKRLQFGPDIAFVYGPLGFVQIDAYSPGSYAWTVGLRAPILILLGYLYFKLLRPLPFVYGEAVAAIILAGSVYSLEAPFGSAAVLATLILAERNLGVVDGVVLALVCGPISLMKFAYFISIGSAYLILSAYRALRWRQYPIALVLWIVAAGMTYLAIGQHLSSIPSFLRSSFSMATGYGEAMQTYGAHLDFLRFGGLAAALLVIFAVSEYREEGVWALFPLTAIALVIGVAAKEGFVRHDDGHQRVAVPMLLVIIALCSASLSRRRVNPMVGALFAMAVAVFFTTMPDATQTFATAGEKVTAFGRLMRDGTGPFELDYQHQFEKIRADFPLPQVPGTADIYSFDQSVLIASGNHYQPRPEFQSLTAYTRYLIQRNVDFLKSPAAPTTIFFDVQPIDFRFPAFEDGASWPELLTRYDITDDTHQFLRLDRRSIPRTYTMAPVLERTIHLGEELQIDKPGDSLIWARIDLRKTLFGKLLAMVSKAPLLMLDITLRDGATRHFRIIPAAAAEGFLLSPVVTSRIDFLALGSPDLRSYLGKQQVVRIRIDPRPFARLCYRDEVPITLEQLELDGNSATLPDSLNAEVRDFENSRRY